MTKLIINLRIGVIIILRNILCISLNSKILPLIQLISKVYREINDVFVCIAEN